MKKSHLECVSRKNAQLFSLLLFRNVPFVINNYHPKHCDRRIPVIIGCNDNTEGSGGNRKQEKKK